MMLEPWQKVDADKPMFMGTMEERARLVAPNDPLSTATPGREFSTKTPGMLANRQDNDVLTARIVRAAMRATGSYHMKLAAGLCDDADLAKLYRFLKS